MYYESFIYNKRFLCIILEYVENGNLETKHSNQPSFPLSTRLIRKWVKHCLEKNALISNISCTYNMVFNTVTAYWPTFWITYLKNNISIDLKIYK